MSSEFNYKQKKVRGDRQHPDREPLPLRHCALATPLGETGGDGGEGAASRISLMLSVTVGRSACRLRKGRR